LLDRAAQIADRLNNSHAKAFVKVMSGMVAYFSGHWTQAVEESEVAGELLRSQCTGVPWERGAAEIVSFVGRSATGELAENRRRLESLTKEAEDRDDLFTALGLRLLGCAYILDAVADQPDRALNGVEQALARWPHP